MTLKTQIATVFGGTGFIGEQVVRELAKLGYTVKVATRVPERAYFLRPCGTVGQIVPFRCDYSEDSIRAAVKGADCVVNCVGVMAEKGKAGSFDFCHVQIPARIAAACRELGVSRLVHFSALTDEAGKARSAQSKRAGEKAVREAFPGATILRPSLVFGPGDGFFTKFAELARFLPFLPLIGGGKTRFQPVFVGDVADAARVALTRETPDASQDPRGKTYALGGPGVYSFRELYEKLFFYTGRKRGLISLPFCYAKMQAIFLPSCLLTRDQVESLKTDSVVTEGAAGFEALGLTPGLLDSVLPDYLETYRPGGRFGDHHSPAEGRRP